MLIVDVNQIEALSRQIALDALGSLCQVDYYRQEAVYILKATDYVLLIVSKMIRLWRLKFAPDPSRLYELTGIRDRDHTVCSSTNQSTS